MRYFTLTEVLNKCIRLLKTYKVKNEIEGFRQESAIEDLKTQLALLKMKA